MRLPHRAIYRQYACDGTSTSSRRLLALAAECTTCTPTAQPENQAPGAVEPNDQLSQSMVIQKNN